MTRTREENAADLQQAATEHEKRERRAFMIAELVDRADRQFKTMAEALYMEVGPTMEERRSVIDDFEGWDNDELINYFVTTDHGGWLNQLIMALEVLEKRKEEVEDEQRVATHEASCDACQNPDASPTPTIDQAIPLPEISLAPDPTTDEELLLLFQLVSSKLQDIRALPSNIKDFVSQDALFKLQGKLRKAMIERDMLDD